MALPAGFISLCPTCGQTPATAAPMCAGGANHAFQVQALPVPAAAASAPLTAAAASTCIGRVLTWMPSSKKKAKGAAASAVAAAGGQWLVSGQCVCVVDPRILLTATHVCFDGQTPYTMRVLHTPIAGGATQAFPAKLLRYSGLMDVSVLLLDAAASPFQPAAIVPAGSPLLAAVPRALTAALTCFPLAIDLMVHPSGEDTVVYDRASRLVREPQLLPGSITGSVPKTSAHKGVTRAFQLGCANYPAFAGCSGGAVFSTELSAAGMPQLLGVHTEAIYQTGQSQLGVLSLVEGEFDGAAAASGAVADAATDAGADAGAASDASGHSHNTRKRKGHPAGGAEGGEELAASSGASSPLKSASAAATGSTTPEDTPTKKVQAKLAEEMQHKSSLSVFLVADAALMQHAAWQPAALIAEAAAAPATAAGASAAASADFEVGIVRVQQEKRAQQASCSFAQDPMLLYD